MNNFTILNIFKDINIGMTYTGHVLAFHCEPAPVLKMFTRDDKNFPKYY